MPDLSLFYVKMFHFHENSLSGLCPLLSSFSCYGSLFPGAFSRAPRTVPMVKN